MFKKYINQKNIGILFVLSGISAFLGMGTQPNISTGIITTGIGVFLIYRSRKEKTVESKDAGIDPANPVKTFSFQVAGFRFDCRFPSGRFHNRQILTAHCRVGDAVTLRQYEWEGEPAFAIISQKHDADLGVVPAIHVNKVLELTEDYRVTGKIIALNEITYRGQHYTTCDIELSCYEK